MTKVKPKGITQDLAAQPGPEHRYPDSHSRMLMVSYHQHGWGMSLDTREPRYQILGHVKEDFCL